MRLERYLILAAITVSISVKTYRCCTTCGILILLQIKKEVSTGRFIS